MTKAMIKLRIAQKEDQKLLEYWDTKKHVIDCAPNDEIDWEEELNRNVDWQEILIAELDARPIGVLVNIDPQLESSHYWGKVEANKRALDIWIGEESDLGKGYGTVMMELMFDRCFKIQKANSILIDPLSSNTKAIKFYKKLGFEFVEERIFDQDLCTVLEKKRGQT